MNRDQHVWKLWLRLANLNKYDDALWERFNIVIIRRFESPG